MTQSNEPDPSREAFQPAAAAARSLAWAAALALLWFVLAGGAASSWIVGVPTIAAALALGRRIGNGMHAPHINPAGVLRLAVYFVRESVRGGIDVAGRVSARRLRVSPGFVRYRWRLPASHPARGLFMLCVSLLPGTLVAAVDEHEILIHALDATAPVADELAALEQRVAGLFALRLSAPKAPDD